MMMDKTIAQTIRERAERCRRYFETEATPLDVALVSVSSGRCDVCNRNYIVLVGVDEPDKTVRDTTDSIGLLPYAGQRTLLWIDTENRRVRVVFEELRDAYRVERNFKSYDEYEACLEVTRDDVYDFDDEALRRLFIPDMLMERGLTIRGAKKAVRRAREQYGLL